MDAQQILKDTFGYDAFRPGQERLIKAVLSGRDVMGIMPTGAGKTYTALEALKGADSGVYLGPLRLLALEVFDKLNTVDIPCSLLTGEESIPIHRRQIQRDACRSHFPNRCGRKSRIHIVHLEPIQGNGYLFHRFLCPDVPRAFCKGRNWSLRERENCQNLKKLPAESFLISFLILLYKLLLIQPLQQSSMF